MNRSTAGLALLGALLATAGCEVVSPSPNRVGTFVLTSVAGDPLPAVLTANDVATLIVVDDRIVLFDDGTAEKHTVVSYGGGPGATSPSETDRSRSTLDYHEVGGEIHLNYRCNDTASCIGPPHLVGRYIEGGLQLDFALNFRVPLVYERID